METNQRNCQAEALKKREMLEVEQRATFEGKYQFI